MSSYRGPFTGPGDEAPDIGPQTGPTGPEIESVTDPAAGSVENSSTPDPTIEPVPEPATAPDPETAAELAPEIAVEAVAEAAVDQDIQSVAAPTSEVTGAWLAAEPTNDTLDGPAPQPDAEAEVQRAAEPTSESTATPPSEIAAEPTIEIIAEVATEETTPTASPTFEPSSTWLAEPVAEPTDKPQDGPAPQPDVEAEVQEPAEPVSEHVPEFAPQLAAHSVAEPVTASAAGISPPSTPVVPPPLLTAPEPIAAPPLPSGSVWLGRLRRATLIFVGLIVGYAALVLVLIVAYRWIDPPRSALMLTAHLSGQSVLYAPVPITRMSSHLQRAVVTSEDARFCYHHGVDWGALFEAMNEARGGSTITMQTAKNLFLWPSRSYIRKAIEIPVALTIDAFWPKQRILEVYLNIAEWGPGIFGAEAAAHYHFDKPASRLTAHEAALLAASLPNPIARDAGEPGRITAILASRLRARMGHSDAFVSCLGLRPTSRPAPKSAPPKVPRAEPKAAPKPALKMKPAAKEGPELPPWRTTTDPAFNPWQN